MTHIVQPDALGITAAVEALRTGSVIGFPTETVYGLAADITNETALRNIFTVKHRPTDHPLIVHVADATQFAALATDVLPAAHALAEMCWPGPLTIIVRAGAQVNKIITGGRDTVAIRLPAHPVALAVIKQLGSPVAAPSANHFGRVSPTTAQHVLADLGDAVALVLDGGPCAIGVESTIVDCTLEQPQILRPGSITSDEIRHVLDRVGVNLAPGITGSSRAPGMLEHHYAPLARLILHEIDEIFDAAGTPILDCSVDPVQAAHSLYAQLRAFDEEGHQLVHVVLPVRRGMGFALRDRLSKAAARR